MNDGFWYRAWQFALLFAAIALLAASVVVQGNRLTTDDVRRIVTEQMGGGGVTAAPGAGSAVDADIVPELVPVGRLAEAPADEVHVAYAPKVPPPITRTDPRIFEVRLEIVEGVCDLDPTNGVKTEMWGYRVAGDEEVVCGTPGPILRGRVGDVARITLTNLPENSLPHNIDFHAVTGQGGGAADLTVAPGETATIQVRLLYPGAFMYHCAYGDVPVHIAHGMYGMFIVDPEVPLPAVDHEWAVLQSEWYVGEPGPDGVAPFDREALALEEPRYVTFNGRTDALTGDNGLVMRVGERARFYMVNEGLNLDSNFHPIGSQWDVVYPEAATHQANRVIRGSQSTLVVAGGGTVTELVGWVPSRIILVDHALVRTFYKGAIGFVEVQGEPQPEIFTATPAESPATTTEVPAEAVRVTITQNAFDPNNADRAFDPQEVRVRAGTTVVWTNRDAVAHTVTSGTSDRTVGTPDGRFDSGLLMEGDTFAFTFTEPGEYSYYCTPHPWMRGKVIVEG